MRPSNGSQRRSLLVSTAVCFIGLIGYGCSGQDQRRVEQPESRDSAGIHIVENVGVAWGEDGGWVVDPEPVLELGRVEGDTLYEFSIITEAARFPDGRIAVADACKCVRVYDAAGRYLITIGREGRGPGEFGEQPFIAVAPPDTLVTWDRASEAVVWFDAQGSPVREEFIGRTISQAGIPVIRGSSGPWELRSDGAVLWVGENLDRLLSSARNRTPEPRLSEEPKRPLLFRGGADASAELKFVDLGDVPCCQSVWYKRGGMRMGSPFSSNRAVRLGPDPWTVSIAAREHWEIRQFDSSGGLRRIIRAAIARAPVTEEMVAAERQRIVERVGRATPISQTSRAFDRLPIPDSLPAINTLHWGVDGRLWVGRMEQDSDGTVQRSPGTYDVFDTDGRWLGTVLIDPDLGRIKEIGNDYILTARQNDLGVDFLRMYRIRRPN